MERLLRMEEIVPDDPSRQKNNNDSNCIFCHVVSLIQGVLRK